MRDPGATTALPLLSGLVSLSLSVSPSSLELCPQASCGSQPGFCLGLLPGYLRDLKATIKYHLALVSGRTLP